LFHLLEVKKKCSLKNYFEKYLKDDFVEPQDYKSSGAEKGFIFDQTNQSYLLQSVGKRINIEPINNVELEPMNSVIVFIGKGIQHKSLDKLIRKSILN
jgi:hypothetical protein